MKVLKKIFKILAVFFGTLSVLIFILAAYNQIALKVEADRLSPPGQMVNMGGHKIHVYTEGKSQNALTLVLLSGSATVAPVYDFKPLYKLLSDEYKIAVVEKAGYGYSDIFEVKRDVNVMVNEVRTALRKADVNPPYVLLPHSMSGLEAIYWSQQFPTEVSGIIGLDMATPSCYDNFDFSKVEKMIGLGHMAAKLGLIRIPGVYPLNQKGLSEEEIYQQKLLAYRNAVNIDYIIEGKTVYDNAQMVKNNGDISCPIIMFSSDGKEVGDFWISAQKEYAQANNAAIEIFDCGHYLHHHKSKEMSVTIKLFIKKING
ncbi:alpha/beta hydrolase [Eubacterium limosum]|uniref:alpha/beta hydrolase n=1 Tax=Eubacterium limosum TaxID=1736 RepID=UPI0022E30350|nr:alpha/beta hydrolase [Eubacterium limosum]